MYPIYLITHLANCNKIKVENIKIFSMAVLTNLLSIVVFNKDYTCHLRTQS